MDNLIDHISYTKKIMALVLAGGVDHIYTT